MNTLTHTTETKDSGITRHAYTYGEHTMIVYTYPTDHSDTFAAINSGKASVAIEAFTGLDDTEPDYILYTSVNGGTHNIETLIADANTARTAVALFLAALTENHHLTTDYITD